MPSQRTDKSMEGQRRVLGSTNIYQQGRGDSAQQVERRPRTEDVRLWCSGTSADRGGRRVLTRL